MTTVTIIFGILSGLSTLLSIYNETIGRHPAANVQTSALTIMETNK